mmetsp:Transcript_19938/g.20252  ORF Transcript_19938/g.20252 Transcript_19938/m.20252 type:complete len:137 (+) Transcript_19938:30-440(+)
MSAAVARRKKQLLIKKQKAAEAASSGGSATEYDALTVRPNSLLISRMVLTTPKPKQERTKLCSSPKAKSADTRNRSMAIMLLSWHPPLLSSFYPGDTLLDLCRKVKYRHQHRSVTTDCVFSVCVGAATASWRWHTG